MPTRISLLLVLFAAISVAPTTGQSAPAPKSSPAKAYTVTVVERYNATLVERGMPDFTVRRQVGEPSRKLDRNTWIYERFEALPSRSATDDCSTLMVVFSEGKVVDLKLLNASAEKIIIARLKAQSDSAKLAIAK